MISSIEKQNPYYKSDFDWKKLTAGLLTGGVSSIINDTKKPVATQTIMTPEQQAAAAKQTQAIADQQAAAQKQIDEVKNKSNMPLYAAIGVIVLLVIVLVIMKKKKS
jgi:hypothetical protein